MTSRVKRNQSTELQVQLLREGIVESVHIAHAVVCDSRGRLLSTAGDSEKETFIRSALKPFQALAVAATGALDYYSLDDKDLAIMCSSHRATMEQVRQVFHILWRANVEPMMLQCPIPEGKDSPLQNNCSGKHAGMLAVCQQRGWPLDSYLNRKHPVQKLILSKVSDLLGMPADEFIVAHDDCGAPTFLMQLSQMATLFAKLSSGDNLEMERIVRAMTGYPALIGGPDAFDTNLMVQSNGELVTKSGAEGVQCIGRLGQSLGVAIKVVDGARRAKYAVAIHLLKQLGWLTPAAAEQLAEKYMELGSFKRLDVVGDLAMV